MKVAEIIKQMDADEKRVQAEWDAMTPKQRQARFEYLDAMDLIEDPSEGIRICAAPPETVH